jgi:RNA polymerase sigma-70 factor (ECF subfamily)
MIDRQTDLASLSDLSLLELMFAHDDAGWREFVRRYDRLVWRCVTRVTARFGSVLGAEDAREIHANFYGSLMANDMHKLRMFNQDRGSKLGTWVGMLASNCAWDYLRASARHPTVDCAGVEVDRPCGDADPFEQTAQRETCARVERLLASFSRKDRDFVLLYYVESRSPEEIADEMGISVKTVYSKKHKIRSRLERLLEQEGLSLAA